MRRILVTGASSGIGQACAAAFLEAGDEVVAHYRTGSAGIAALRDRHGPRRLRAVRADLSRESGCVRLVRAAGRFDHLVHSAGIWREGAIRTLSRAELDEMFRTNTYSAYLLAREAAAAMRRGSMIFIGSTAGQRGEPGHSPYAGSKAALWGLVQSLAQELAPEIRVNLVSPGWVRTPMAEPTFAEPGRLRRIVSAIPLRRVAEAEDVAAAVLFLADEQQRHLTGIDLPVSGGALLPMPRG
jgi:3-oxoacyl-[acyl-carrier protein] reductase